MEIFVVTGQTATGKTALSLEKARLNNADIVNFDARQVYKKLDIVTGKDFEKPEFHKTGSLGTLDIGYYVIGGVKVWLYDIVDPKQYFSSYDYTSCALQVLRMLDKEGKNVVLTGGTYLYLYHLLYRVETENIPPDRQVRSGFAKVEVKELQKRLQSIDPVLFGSLNNSERNNPQRLIRKIEIATYYKDRGERVPLAMKHEFKENMPGHMADMTALSFKDREKVAETVKKRVAKRLEEGAVEEVRKLLSSGYTINDPGMRTIGYAELAGFVQGSSSLEEAVALWTTHEIQYTKRQLTFMKKDPHLNWTLL